MVKKLLKHEFIYYLRTFAMFLPIVLVVGAMVKVFRLLDNGEVFSEFAIFSSSAMLAVTCAGLLVLGTVICVVRFYKNMYGAEGYLTFTLPVTNAQHIFVKLLTALVCQAVCVLTVIIAVCIALSGDLLDAFVQDMSMTFKYLFMDFDAVNGVIFLVEILAIFVLAAAANMLLFYGCITVGQTAKKNRILKAVGAYFVYYIASQVISTVFTVVIMALGMAGLLDEIAMWVAKNPVLVIHGYLIFYLLILGGMAALFWFVTQTIMTKKLNLE